MLFVPGITRGNPLTEAMAKAAGQPMGGPFFFWACPVELTDPLPEGVEGQEMLYTSPYALLEDPPPGNVQPMNFQAPIQMQNAYYETWVQGFQARLSEPRRQVSVMAAVRGPFTSYFEGKTTPRAFGEEDPVKVVQDPLDLPISIDPLAGPPAETAGETGATGAPGTETKPTETKPPENKPTEGTDTETKPAKGTGTEGTGTPKPTEGTETVDPGQREEGVTTQTDAAAEAATAGDPGPENAGLVGQDPGQEGPPPPPKPEPQDPEQDPDREADPVYRAVAPGRLVVVGDADFLRDDLIGSMAKGFPYQRIGGPVSSFGRPFFVNMLDWLHQESDLNALHNRNLTTRMLVFAEQSPTEPIEQFSQRLTAKISVLRWGNILVPPLLLVVLGCVLGLVRRSQKKSFLSSVEN